MPIRIAIVQSTSAWLDLAAAGTLDVFALHREERVVNGEVVGRADLQVLPVTDQQHSIVNVQGSVALCVNRDDQGALTVGGDFHVAIVDAVSAAVGDLDVVRALELRQGPIEGQHQLVRRFGNGRPALRFFLNQKLARAGRGCHRQRRQDDDCANHGQHGAREAGSSAHR